MLRPSTIRFGMVNCFKLLFSHGGAHPDVLNAIYGPKGPAKSLDLSGGLNADAHQLHLVHHPEAIIIEQPEVHRPPVPAHAVAAIQRPGEQHVLGSDYYGVPLRIDVPVIFIFTAHEHSDGDASPIDLGIRFPSVPAACIRRRFVPGRLSEQSQVFQPHPGLLFRLLDQRPHGQAVHQPPGRGRPLLRPGKAPAP